MHSHDDIALDLDAPLREETVIARRESREIGQRVRAELQSKPISQAALARRMGLSPGQLSKMLKGGRNFSLEQVLRAAEALECAPERIIPDQGRIAALLERHRARNEAAVGTGCARGALIVATKRVADMTSAERIAALGQVNQLRAALLQANGLDETVAKTPEIVADGVGAALDRIQGDPDDYQLA